MNDKRSRGRVGWAALFCGVAMAASGAALWHFFSTPRPEIFQISGATSAPNTRVRRPAITYDATKPEPVTISMAQLPGQPVVPARPQRPPQSPPQPPPQSPGRPAIPLAVEVSRSGPRPIPPASPKPAKPAPRAPAYDPTTPEPVRLTMATLAADNTPPGLPGEVARQWLDSEKSLLAAVSQWQDDLSNRRVPAVRRIKTMAEAIAKTQLSWRDLMLVRNGLAFVEGEKPATPLYRPIVQRAGDDLDRLATPQDEAARREVADVMAWLGKLHFILPQQQDWPTLALTLAIRHKWEPPSSYAHFSYAEYLYATRRYREAAVVLRDVVEQPQNQKVDRIRWMYLSALTLEGNQDAVSAELNHWIEDCSPSEAEKQKMQQRLQTPRPATRPMPAA